MMKEKRMKRCYEVMTENPVSCLISDTVERAARLMQLEDIGAVPVVENYENKRLIGIVTDRDLALRVVGAGQNFKDLRVKDVMTPNPVTCYPSDDLDTARETMLQHQVRRLPAVNEDGQLVGIIAQADLATRVRDQQKTAEFLQEISTSAPLTVLP
jgi:CBS domain-containing protein